MKLHPKFIKQENRDFVVIPFEEYKFLEDQWHDYQDLCDLREAIAEAKANGDKGMPHAQVFAELRMRTPVVTP
ncbi:MAG: type II toxin-antitoxin system Phd/YefM family antitoxin [Gammaproteobacteria bacterium]